MAVLANGRSVPASLVKDGAVTLGGQAIQVVDYVGGGIPARPQGPQPRPGEPGGPEGPLVPRDAIAPKLNKQQQARFNDIKREIPGASDERVLSYMRQKGWLK